ncbi:hypothetical protein BC939DRAFT_506087 [Gamsiella multidivaricata]|uniref:uncharacterized protein n=1 Tax=Gamsiella multidivaricata TaxID=101098 RepID=UPI0022207F7C|nr:uncharacterized protein BC939DRAFT_506087 [Gamsiella multidivaricata]KAI7818986.1 hypothetical protein BC939DRAFT_506087 [Gamsiella multidivaricata]
MAAATGTQSREHLALLTLTLAAIAPPLAIRNIQATHSSPQSTLKDRSRTQTWLLEHAGARNSDDTDPANTGGLFEYSPAEEKRLVWKIDWWTLSSLGMLYGVSTLDRANLLNAKLFAFESALDVTPEQCLATSPDVYLGLHHVWVSLDKGPAPPLRGSILLRCRGTSARPRCPNLHLYVFYKRSEQTFRMAILQAFISCGIGNLDGKLDLQSWQWTFVVESLVTVLSAGIRNDTKVKVMKHISRQNNVVAIKDRNVYLFMAINLLVAITSNALVVAFVSALCGPCSLFLRNTKTFRIYPLASSAEQPSLKQASILVHGWGSQSPQGRHSITRRHASTCGHGAARQRGTILMVLEAPTMIGYDLELLTLNAAI